MKTSTKTDNPSRKLGVELKTLWGAMAWPFAAAVKTPYESKPFNDTLEQLTQLLAVKASGILCGPNGVGKSLLLKALLDRLPAKTYRPMVVTHSSMSPSDLLRHLCQIQGLSASIRRSDNAISLRNMWRELEPLWPVLIFEEGSRYATARCYLHTGDYAPQGWYEAAERTIPLRMPFES